MQPLHYSEMHNGAFVGEFYWSGLIPAPANPPSAQEFETLRRYRDHLRPAMLAAIRRQENLGSLRGDLMRELGIDEQTGANSRIWTLIKNVADEVQEVVFAMKSKYDLARPSQFDCDLRPPIDVPSYSSYPSGHAAIGLAMALVASRFATNGTCQARLIALGLEVGVNREIAGLHFPSDTAAGVVVALAMCQRMTTDSFVSDLNAALSVYRNEGYRCRS